MKGSPGPKRAGVPLTSILRLMLALLCASEGRFEELAPVTNYVVSKFVGGNDNFD